MTSSVTNLRPLDGITVVSVEQAIAAPFCSRQLADLGARVIKIERLGSGDFARGYDQRVKGLASHFIWTNRTKESITLNLKNTAGVAILKELLAKADVFIQNLAPNATARMGLSFAELHEQFPQLIVCNISGYGKGGPYEQKKAYDLLIQSEGGFLSVTGGSKEDEMAKAGCSIADISAGMYGYSSILAALLLRNKTGKGSEIDVSMLETLVEWMGYPMYYAFEGAPPPPRAGASHATIYPYGPFPVGNGASIMLGLQNEREWALFCEKVLIEPQLITDERFSSNFSRSANRAALREIIIQTFATLTVEQVIERLEDAKIANAKVNDMAGVWHHPQLQARDVWVEIDSAVGSLPAMLPPARSNAYQSKMGAVPKLGEHTKRILTELGYASAEIIELAEQNII